MARRSQPARLQWPITPEQLERIDQMFQELYDDTDNGSLEVSADQLTGTIPVTRGGTGILSYTIGDLIYASATTTLSALADVAIGQVLRSGGVGAAPAWGKVNLATDVSGAVGVSNGGTGLSTYAVGDLLYASALNTLSQLNATAVAGAYLRSGGVGVAPLWSTLILGNSATQGDIFYCAVTNQMTTLPKDTNATRYVSNGGGSNNPIWAQINLANGVTGTLPVANGGTAVNSATQTYTPTLTNVTNVAASTAFACQYLRVGNTVVVSGKVSIDPTAAGATELGISLPVASALATEQQVGGTAAAPGIAGQCAGIRADATNDRAALVFTAVDVTNQDWFFSFTYQVL